MTNPASGPLDEEVLRTIQARLAGHEQFQQVSFEPSPEQIRTVVAHYDPKEYPAVVETARLDIRWHIGSDYSVHYIEQHADGTTWEIRWDRHTEEAGRRHVHPPPDAGAPTATDLPGDYRDLLSLVRTYVTERIESLWERSSDT